MKKTIKNFKKFSPIDKVAVTTNLTYLYIKLMLPDLNASTPSDHNPSTHGLAPYI